MRHPPYILFILHKPNPMITWLRLYSMTSSDNLTLPTNTQTFKTKPPDPIWKNATAFTIWVQKLTSSPFEKRSWSRYWIPLLVLMPSTSWTVRQRSKFFIHIQKSQVHLVYYLELFVIQIVNCPSRWSLYHWLFVWITIPTEWWVQQCTRYELSSLGKIKNYSQESNEKKERQWRIGCPRKTLFQ